MSTVITWLENAMKWALSCLPDSPFTLLDNSPIKEYLGYINWFLPFDFVVATLQVWLAAIAIYYIYSAVLRWVKAIN